MATHRLRTDFGAAIGLSGWLAAAFVALPPAVVIPMSLVGDRSIRLPPRIWSTEPYRRILSDGGWRRAMLQSLVVASCVAAIASALGLAGAYAVQHTGARVRRCATAALLLPLLVPPVVLAVGQLLMFSRIGLFDTSLGLIIGHTVLALPLTFLVHLAAFARVSLGLEAAARTLGATRLFSFWSVTRPQLRTATASAAALAFVTSFDEPVLSLFLTSTRARTLPRQMFDAIRYNLDPTAAAVSTVLLLVSMLVLATTRTGAMPLQAPSSRGSR